MIIGQPDQRFQKVFDTVVEARDRAIAAIKSGVSGTWVDNIARSHIEDNGFADKFGHSLGHGTGLAVHEAPRLSPIKDDRLETGMIVTVEPGIYVPDLGGVRIEDDVLVTSALPEVLTEGTPKAVEEVERIMAEDPGEAVSLA